MDLLIAIAILVVGCIVTLLVVRRYLDREGRVGEVVRRLIVAVKRE